MEKERTGSAWVFNLDAVNDWAFWDGAFSKEECEQIVAIGKKRELQAAKFNDTQNNQVENLDVRKSRVSWLVPADDTVWIYRRLTDIITDLNDNYFKFDIFGITEPLQFTEYGGDGGHYGGHLDKCYGNLVRKLSISVQLTDPKEYEGGELLLYVSEDPATMSKETGTLIAFPSYCLHKVAPVTSGTRYSLVAWVSGKQFT